MKPVIYVAAPFSHPKKHIRDFRFNEATKYAAALMQNGHVVFSPLSHSVPISEYLDNPNDSDFYINQDLFWLAQCDELHVLMLRGYEKSSGIKREIEEAEKWDISIRYVMPRGKK